MIDININLGGASRGLDASGSQGGTLQGSIASGAQKVNQLSQSMTESIVDLLSEILVKALFDKKGEGATFGEGTKGSEGNNKLLELIAKFMDDNGDSYRGPHDATGNVRNWQDELKEDNYLSKDELSDFKSGLKDALMQLFSGGGLGGNTSGASSAAQPAAQSFSPAMSGMTGGGAQAMSPMQQQGFGMGGDLGKHMMKSSIDGLGVDQFLGKADRFSGNSSKPMDQVVNSMVAGRFEFADEDKDTARTIGKMMDMNPEVFGKQPRGGWASRIESGKDFEPAEMQRFQSAANMLKDSIDGKSTGDSELDMDLRLTAGALMNDAMNKVAA
ncbi:hypothetical protein [Marinomonas mediterranea]|uniref:hypothetical protein n=1 Tax=Marinomonas mediterranea TaxID=119864 RepID=UPI00234A1C95|nr:hypothetical protein [Marinomonas mediterranea]WCN08416.1 hypothetical protein GV055_05520 [Marinomonas mediterranea]